MRVFGLMLVFSSALAAPFSPAPAQQAAIVQTAAIESRSITTLHNGVKTRKTIPFRVIVKRKGEASSVTPPSAERAARPRPSLARTLTVQSPARYATASVSKTVAAAHPHVSGPPKDPVSYQFAPTIVGSSSGDVTLAFTPPDTSSTLTVSLFAGLNYTVDSANCSSSSCTVNIAFKPAYPGLLTDALTIADSNGNLIHKTFLSGVGSAGQFAYLYGQETDYQGYTPAPAGITIGPDENYYLGDRSAGTVLKFSKGFNDSTTLPFNGLATPAGIAVDGAGTVYVADATNNAVLALTTSGLQSKVATTPLAQPSGLAVDGTGDLFIVDSGNGRVLEIDIQGNETEIASDLTGPQGLAVDLAGNVYIADQGNGGQVLQYSPASGTIRSLTDQLGTLSGIAVDASGTIYYAFSGGFGSIYPLSGNVQSGCYHQDCQTGGPYAIAVDRNGDLIYTFPSQSKIDTDDRTDGNFILSAAPNQTVSGSVSVANTGTTSLTFSGLNVSGPTFTYDSSSTCTSTTVLTTQSTCEVTTDFTPPAAQNYSETLTITSDSLNASGTSDAFTLYGEGQSVPSQISLSVDNSTPTAGQTVTFTGTVAAGTYTTEPGPTGSLSFYDGDSLLSTVNISTVTGNSASYSTSSLAAGSHSITARYNGDVNYAPSTSAAQTVTVGSAALTPTTTQLRISSTSITAGTSDPLTATVTASGNGVPGSVTFSDQSGTIGSATLNVGDGTSTATYNATALSAGSHQITATYTGTSTYAASASAAQTVTVTAASSSARPVTVTLPPGSTVAQGTQILLAPRVSDASTGLALTAGQVILCDASVTDCTPEISLGLIQLINNSDRRAYLALTPSIGTHTYKAVFLATSAYQSGSSALVTYTVTGIHSDTTTITATGKPGAYTLTGTVVGVGSPSLAPTGAVTFNDTTSASVLGTGNLGSGTLGFNSVQPTGSPATVGTAPYGVATADFNGDGFADIVTENYKGGTISVLLGHGDGTFQSAVSYTVGSLPERVLIADVNADGYPDIVVANTGSSTISVLVNNGNGTFQTQVTYAASSPVGLGVEDLNHDGFPDIVAGDYYSNTFSVLLNNGNGTFAAAVTYPTGGTPQTLAEGDFNGDGNVDVAVGNLAGNNVGIYLGKGDGTFAPAATYPVGKAPQGVSVGDFNADGKEDLAVVNSTDNTISILLGNGDGSFQTQVTYPVGADPVGIVVADFNGDGRQDLSVGNTAQSALTQSILLGNGDGTFQPQLTFRTGNFPYGEAVADFDGDGFPDLAIADFSDSTVTVLLSRVTQTATASLTGVAVTGSGTHTATASYPGDTNFGASTSTSTPLTPATLSPSTTTLTIIPTTQAAGSPVNLSVAVTGTQSSTTPSGTVTFTNVAVTPAVVLGSVTLSSAGTGVFGSYFSQAGTYSIVATYSGDTTFAASASAPQTLTITPIASATTLSVSAPAITAGQTETLTATITGGATPAETGTVTFADQNGTLGTGNVTPTSTGSTASVALNTLAPGTHLITATYNGDTNHLPSTSATQTVTVAAGPGVSPTITTLTAVSPTVAYKSPAILTAAVTAPATGAAIATGQVILCTSTAVRCSPELALAIAQLTSAGTATFRLAPGTIGAHAYKAVFLATSAANTSTSPALTVTVTGTFADTTTLTASGTPGAYSLTATTVGLASPTLAPSGSIIFNDTTANAALGSAILGHTTSAFSTSQPSGSPIAAGYEYDGAVADFNRDGFPDIVVAGTGSESAGSVSVLFGNGDGTFKSPISTPLNVNSLRVSTGEFNGDGVPDLVVTGNGNSIGILIGIGDGTFKPAVSYMGAGATSQNSGFNKTLVADLNHDGFADIIAVDGSTSTVSVFLGNGDGTFKQATGFPVTQASGLLALGDFNKDGNADLALCLSGSVAIYLGAGDGTFTSNGTYTAGSLGSDIKVGDFNGDGIDDLAAANLGANTVDILIGVGDGNFQQKVSYAVGNDPQTLSVADFNQDGKQDIVVAGFAGTDAPMMSYLLGNGDGTFQPQITSTANYPVATPTGDFNGDGLPDLALIDDQSSTNSVTILLSQVTQTATAILNNVAVGAPTGSHQITASYPGNTSFSASTSAAIPLINPAKTTPTTSLTVTPASQAAGQAVALTALVTAPAGLATVPTGTVTFTYTGTATGTLGTASLAQGSTTISTNSLLPGTYSLLATYSGDTVFNASASPLASLTIVALPTATTLQATPTTLSLGATESLTATVTGGTTPAQTGSVTFYDGTSALATVNITATSTGATASYSTKTLSLGAHQITARYSGDPSYATSTSLAQTVTVTSSATTVTLTPSAATLTAIQSETLTATILGGTLPAETGTVTFADQTGTLGTATVIPTTTGSVATLTLPTLAVLTHQITARYSGDANYAAATSVAVPVVVSLATQTITFPPIPSHHVGDSVFTLAATSSSNLPITYSLVSGPATLSGINVTVTGVGTVVIQAAQPGNAQYAAATPVTQTFTVAYLNPTLASITPNSGVVGNGNTTIALLGTNFALTDQVLLNGTVIASTYSSPTTLSAVVPASFFSAVAVGLITVHDTASNLTTSSVNFSVTTGPGITFTGPSTASSGQQPTLSFTLANPYPVALSGTISLTFTPGSSTLTDDPNVVFSNGTRTITYNIPANSTVTPAVQLQTGTVSGTATITLSVAAGGVNINLPSVAPVVITIPPAAPSITSTLPLVRSGGSLTVSFIGYSNTREATKAIFHFTAVPGGNLATQDVTVDVTQDFALFYGSAASDQYGSSFTFTQPFTLSQDASVIQSVTVTLVNTIGSSSQVSFQ